MMIYQTKQRLLFIMKRSNNATHNSSQNDFLITVKFLYNTNKSYYKYQSILKSAKKSLESILTFNK